MNTVAEEDPSSQGQSPVVWYYAVIGVAVVLVAMSLAIIIVLVLGKRKRISAKIWRPTSPSEPSPVPAGGSAGGTIVGTESSL